MDKSIADIRKDYTLQDLSEKEIDSNPFVQFKIWFGQSLAAQLPEPNAMTLATCTPNGRPSARMVLPRILMKGVLSYLLIIIVKKDRNSRQIPLLLWFFGGLN